MASLWFSVGFYFKFYHYSVWDYYQNFGLYLTGKRNFSEYATWFNPQTEVNYRIASEIAAGSTNNERVFVWGDEPMIYALSRRLPAGKYTAKYHIKGFEAEKETMKSLNDVKPKFIVVLNPTEDLPGLLELLDRYYLKYKAIDGGILYRLSRVELL